MRRRYQLLLVAIVVIAGLSAGGYTWYRYAYPFGHSHCCDKQLHVALANYADNHSGNFPAGEATPEASLSLVHREDEHGWAYLLCGKTGSESLAQEILDRGELLDPDSCGWNYIEGLRLDDDHKLALFWDKEGLGHNGQRLTGGGHVVMFVDGFTRHIPAVDWDRFLAEQKILFTQRKKLRKVQSQGP